MISVYTFCDNTPMDTMGNRLKWAREQAGFNSATAAAKHHHWPVSTYSAHENGQNNFDPETAEKYAAAFKVNSGWLLTGKGDRRLTDKPFQTDQRLEHLTGLVEQLINLVQRLTTDRDPRSPPPSPPSGKSKRN